VTSLGELLEAGAPRVTFVFDDQQVAGATVWHESSAAAAWFARRSGETVGIILSAWMPSVVALVGGLRSGATLASLPHPRPADLEAYVTDLDRLCAQAGITTIVAEPAYQRLLDPLRAKVVTPADVREPGRSSGGDGTFIQFSSGSTGAPKGIVLGHAEMAANIVAILDALEVQPGDGICSWLPLSHDMGLMGGLLAAIVGGGPRWTGGGHVGLLSPEAFLGRPESWLEACSALGSTITLAPDFAYRLVARRAERHGPIGLGRLRACLIGAEPVRADTLRGFGEAFGGAGFDQVAFCPAYGLAEATLAVTLVRPEVRPASLRLDAAALAAGEVLRLDDGDRRPARELVGCGPPLPGVAIGADHNVGEVTVESPSLLRRYFGEPCDRPPGAFRTSDLGFVDASGNLHLCGRNDEVITTAGRNVMLQDLDEAAASVPEVRVAFGAAGPDGPVVFSEVAQGVDATTVARTVRGAVARQTGVAPQVLLVAPRSLPRTTSGKPRRDEAVRRWTSGQLAVRET
jgi:acyl-CoA synthetase (AMP-forming)/AMP-acid ligase II